MKSTVPPLSSPLSRRTFLRRAAACGALAALPGFAFDRRTVPDTIRIGHIVLGSLPDGAVEAAASGARMGAEEAAYNAQLFGSTLEHTLVTPASSAEAMGAARTLVEEENVDILVTYMDDEALVDISQLAEENDVLMINAGSPMDDLRGAQCHALLFHMAPSAAMQADAVGLWALSEGLSRWSVVSPDTEAGQALATRAQQLMDEHGGEAASTHTVASGTSNFSAVLDEIASANPDAVFLNLSGDEQLAFLEQYAARDADFDVVGPLPEVHRMQAEGVLAGVWPLLWHPGLFKYGASQPSERFERQYGRPMDGAAWVNWATVTFATETALKAGTTEPGAMADYLVGPGRYDGRKGKPLTFRSWDHQSRHVLYVARGDAEAEGYPFELLAEIPDDLPDAPSVEDNRDQLGVSQEASACTLSE